MKEKITKASDGTEIWWHSITENGFRLSGFYWYDSDKIFRRLPVDSIEIIEKVNPNVNALADNTAGGQLAFKTNSSKILIRAELTNKSGYMNNMTSTGQSGFDCYAKYSGSQRFTCEGVACVEVNAIEYQSEMCMDLGGEVKEILLNFPLYNGVKAVEIGLERNAEILPPDPFCIDNPIIFYGTSIAQGGCATRPGMGYTNIISRDLNARHINLGFSGNGLGEKEVAEQICRIENPSCIIIDIEANAGVYGTLEKNLDNFVEILRQKHEETPILIVSRLPYQSETHNIEKVRIRNKYREFQRQVVFERQSRGDKNIYFKNGFELMDEYADEYFVDTIHPTDLGFAQMAKNFDELLKVILKV